VSQTNRSLRDGHTAAGRGVGDASGGFTFRISTPPNAENIKTWGRMISINDQSLDDYIHVIDKALTVDWSNRDRKALLSLREDILAAKDNARDLDRIIRGFQRSSGGSGAGKGSGGGSNKPPPGGGTGGEGDDPRDPGIFRRLIEAAELMMKSAAEFARRLFSIIKAPAILLWQEFWTMAASDFVRVIARASVKVILVYFGIDIDI
jgi:hypothetical protein